MLMLNFTRYIMQENKEDFSNDDLLYFYKYIILPWEMEWEKINLVADKKEVLTKYNECIENNIDETRENKETIIKYLNSKSNTGKGAVKEEYDDVDCKKYDTIILFNKTTADKKILPFSKALLKRLRNCFVHGHFSKKIINGRKCIMLEDAYLCKENERNMIGFISIEHLKALVKAVGESNDK